jgi:hypothetical protein
VLKLLEAQGIAPQRMRLSQAGGYEPCTLEVENKQHLQDARVEIYLLSELAQDYAKSHTSPVAEGESPDSRPQREPAH